MERFLATMLQTIQDPNSQPPPLMSDSGSIWHHMSDALHQSVYRVLSLLIAVLPGILAVFVALTLFTLIGMALSTILRKGLTFLKFDERLNRGNSEWTPVQFSDSLDCASRILGLRAAWTWSSECRHSTLLMQRALHCRFRCCLI